MKTWDIFCRVIDNYGDIGVCWRLARQLVNEHPFNVRLWVDDIAALKHIWPETLLQPRQMLNGVNVCLWQQNFHCDYIADVVIEAFACNLPDTYIVQMKQATNTPRWINLEYLSAETWVEGCHSLASMHPQTGLKKTFFFPGFTDKTGGLLREYDLLLRRDHFLLSDQKHLFLSRLGVTQLPDNTLVISLFGYENAAINSLLHHWNQTSYPIMCLVPAGKTLTAINAVLNTHLCAGETYQQDTLQIQAIPFLTQDEYDQLLWACDINFVRGEDSFVRAQWAGKPFIWHIYPQEDDVHIIKLKAFLDKYLEHMQPTQANLLRQLWLNWNTGSYCDEIWGKNLLQHQDWLKHSHQWCEDLSRHTDLATNLVQFCQKKL